MRYILLSAWVICISFFTLSFRSVISVRFTESWIKLMCRKRRLLRKRKIKLLQLLWMQRSVGLRLGCLRRCLSCRGWPWRRYCIGVFGPSISLCINHWLGFFYYDMICSIRFSLEILPTLHLTKYERDGEDDGVSDKCYGWLLRWDTYLTSSIWEA